jgi:hypothetical protein
MIQETTAKLVVTAEEGLLGCSDESLEQSSAAAFSSPTPSTLAP